MLLCEDEETKLTTAVCHHNSKKYALISVNNRSVNLWLVPANVQYSGCVNQNSLPSFNHHPHQPNNYNFLTFLLTIKGFYTISQKGLLKNAYKYLRRWFMII